MTRVLPLLSTSVAADLGFLALADIAVVAAALRNAEWRIIGGHMVQLLIHRYPTPNCQQRGTADADAGVGPQIAASAELHERLRQRDYRDECGNRYVRTHPDGTIAIDILVPDGADAGANIIAGRAFDPAPGLRFALAGPALSISANARLTDGTAVVFDVQVPDVEAAVVLKTLAWGSRRADKDLVDLANLFEIVELHRAVLSRWQPDKAPGTGARLDTARTLAGLVRAIDRGALGRGILPGPPARLGALIRRHVALPR